MLFQLSDIAKQLLQTDLTMAQMEEFAFGRILSKYVPEIISSRESTKQKKCDSILQTSNTWNYLKSNRPIAGLILRSLKDQHSIAMGGNRMYIDSCHNYLCCVPDGNIFNAKLHSIHDYYYQVHIHFQVVFHLMKCRSQFFILQLLLKMVQWCCLLKKT